MRDILHCSWFFPFLKDDVTWMLEVQIDRGLRKFPALRNSAGGFTAAMISSPRPELWNKKDWKDRAYLKNFFFLK